MSLKDELIKGLTLKQLKELAQENRVLLRRGDWILGDKTVTTKKRNYCTLNEFTKNY